MVMKRSIMRAQSMIWVSVLGMKHLYFWVKKEKHIILFNTPQITISLQERKLIQPISTNSDNKSSSCRKVI